MVVEWRGHLLSILAGDEYRLCCGLVLPANGFGAPVEEVGEEDAFLLRLGIASSKCPDRRTEP